MEFKIYNHHLDIHFLIFFLIGNLRLGDHFFKVFNRHISKHRTINVRYTWYHIFLFYCQFPHSHISFSH